MSKKPAKLSFEEHQPQNRLSHAARDAPINLLQESVRRSIYTDEEGQESSPSIPYTAPYHSNARSKAYQKQAFQKSYVSNIRQTGATTSAAPVEKQTMPIRKKLRELVSGHKKGLFIAAGALSVLLIFSVIFSSCSVLFNGLSGIVTTTTYPSKDEDMYAAEAEYCRMEAELQEKLNRYTETHDYDEYSFDLDEIQHDPYVLISAVTALYGQEWTIDQVGDILQLLFESQYILTETVTEEIRYREELRTGTRLVYDSASGSYAQVPYTYTVQVPYTYRICKVRLENFDLSHVPVYVMTEDQLSLYATYMATLGNRPDLFGGSSYVQNYYGTTHPAYTIPPEALEDEQFALMIKEAEKYLGYPYVWGGSSPSTSFDCSGFVSWVCNHCGVGWNFGRLSAEGIRQICTPVPAASAKPGDLIFFEKTYDTPGASHIGIYVGNNMMIHCGDPIQYSDISGSYWQQHFLSFGRLPMP